MTTSRARRSLLVLSLPALAAIVGLIALGNWQMRRLQWKQDLVHTVEQRTGLAPVAAPEPRSWSALDDKKWAYRPVAVAGRYHHDKEIHVFTSVSRPRGRFGGSGYLILTPLETPDGWFVWVNRGFVPANKKPAATRSRGQMPGQLTISGLFREAQIRAPYAPADDLAKNVWFSRDPTAMTLNAGLPEAVTAPYSIDADATHPPPGGLPQPGETRLTFTNSHLQYALTWYGLAAALAAVFGALAWSKRRGRPLPGGR
jgi:surfeit locus 1 family protein